MSKTVNEVKELVIEAIIKGTGEYKGDFGTALFELDMDGIANDFEILTEREEVITMNFHDRMNELNKYKARVAELEKELARFKND